MPRVLIADDEANLRATLARTLRAEGYETVEARDGVEAVSRLQHGGIDVVLLDLNMPRLDGFGVLDSLKEEDGAPPVLVLTGNASIENAVRAVKQGAWDFIEKPPAAEAILLRVQRALQSAHREAERESAPQPEAQEMIGDSPPMRELKSAIERVAPTPARVLIVGENGTGKELVARAVHHRSQRADGPLVRVNCAALPAELFEAELFGHVKGAFTGAVSNRRGRFERASGGTLFLDEIGEIPVNVQPKLLRALEEGEIERVGAEHSASVDVRVIAATNRDLPRMVAEGSFREDLFYRLEVVTLQVPPLRERRSDVPALATTLLAAACREMGRSALTLADDALDVLSRQNWPGNVRQLRNVLERLAIMIPAEEEAVDARQLRPHLGQADFGPIAADSQAPGPLSDAVASFERQRIEQTIERLGGNVSAAARELGLERSSLYKKMKSLGMRPTRS